MTREKFEHLIKDAKRVVIKIGTSSLTHSTGKINLEMIEKICRQITNLQFQGKEVLLVSSGAVGAGMGKLGYDKKPKSIPEKQAAAAIGQGILMHIYEKMFSEYGQVVAQLLLTKDDISNRKRYLNARNTLLALLNKKVIPIINENDTVVVEEIKFGDNDTLAALVGTMVNADLLVLLTDIDGLYTDDPRYSEDAKKIDLVEEIDEEIMSLAGDPGSEFGSGGMITKLEAAKIAVNAGVPMLIGNSETENIINRIFKGEEIGTLFLPRDTNPHTKKKWIGFGSEIKGKIFVDSGCKEALLKDGKSLLPSGIKSVEEDFESGSVVSIADEYGVEFARGIAYYSSDEIVKIMGKSSKEIKKNIGHKENDEVVHRDNLIIRY